MLALLRGLLIALAVGPVGTSVVLAADDNTVRCSELPTEGFHWVCKKVDSTTGETINAGSESESRTDDQLCLIHALQLIKKSNPNLFTAMGKACPKEWGQGGSVRYGEKAQRIRAAAKGLK